MGADPASRSCRPFSGNHLPDSGADSIAAVRSAFETPIPAIIYFNMSLRPLRSAAGVQRRTLFRIGLGLLTAMCALALSHAPLVAQGNPRESIQNHFRSGTLALEQHELDKAESDFREILGTALDQLGAIHSGLTEYKDAQKAYEEACKATITSIRPYIGLAIIYLRIGQFREGKDLLNAILEINPTNPQAKHLLGKFYYMEGDYRAAARELGDAHDLAPEDASVAYTLALAYLEQRQKEEAERIFKQMLDQLGETAGIRILFGRAYRATEYWQEAVTEFQRALELEPELPRALYNLGLTHLLWEGAVAFRPAEEAFLKSLKGDPDQYVPNLYLGVINTIKEDDAAALSYLEKAAQLNPENPDPYLYIGQILVRGQNPVAGIAALKKSIDLTADPSRNNFQVSNAHYVLGQALLKQGERTEALVHINRSQELKRIQGRASQEEFQRKTESGGTLTGSGMAARDFRDLGQDEETEVIIGEPPPDPSTSEMLRRTAVFYRGAAASAYQFMARIETERGDFSRAGEYLGLSLGWDESSPGTLFNMGLAFYKAEDYVKAAPALTRAFKEDPTKRETLQLLADTSLRLVQSRQAAAAIEALDILVKESPELADLWVLRGQAYAQKGNYDLALECFETALKRNPGLQEVHYYAGMSLIRQGQLAQAITEFDRELAKNPSHAMALYHKAFVLITQNNMDEALPLLNRVIELNPRYSEAYYQLGKIQMEKGELLLAVVNLEIATKLSPDKSHVFYQLSRAYMRSDRRGDAEKALERYRELKKIEEEARAANTEQSFLVE